VYDEIDGLQRADGTREAIRISGIGDELARPDLVGSGAQRFHAARRKYYVVTQFA
jgi:hypothetical protein